MRSSEKSIDSGTNWEAWPLTARLRFLGGLRAKRWKRRAHDGQAEPPGEWRTWYVQGARGSGKTQTGAEVFGGWVLANPPGAWAIVAPTFADARDKCVEGESGILAVLGPAVDTWNRSIGEIKLHTEARIIIDGADDGAPGIQGENLMGAWLDEIGLFKKWQMTWEESISFAVRKDPARIIATGTPKGKVGLVKQLLTEPDCVITRTYLEDNEENLSAAQVAALRRRHEGTRLGAQELHGEILDDVEGALFKWANLEQHRLDPELLDAILGTIGVRTVVAVDPAITATEDSDETGIIGACAIPAHADVLGGVRHVQGTETPIERPPHGFIVADASGRYAPQEWAEQAVALYRHLDADRIVAEANQGGDMVAAVIREVDPNVPIELVHATKGKRTRAEPVAALAEQGRYHHVGVLPELESEQTSWVPGDPSPSRMDAAVWAITSLILDAEQIVSVPRPTGPGSITGDLLTRKF